MAIFFRKKDYLGFYMTMSERLMRKILIFPWTQGILRKTRIVGYNQCFNNAFGVLLIVARSYNVNLFLFK